MNLIELPGGDMFSSGAAALVNPVNTVGVMGKGLALEFKRRFPRAAEEYVQACKTKTLSIGGVLVSRTQEPIVIHFPTKGDWRRASQLHYIDRGLVLLWKAINDNKIPSIAIPALGCGEGGLAWKDVRLLIVGHLQSLDVTVYLYPPR